MAGVIPDRKTAERWSAATRQVEGINLTNVNTPMRRRYPGRGGASVSVGLASTTGEILPMTNGISGGSGFATLGSGPGVELVQDANNLAKWDATGGGITLYNATTAKLPANKLVQFKRIGGIAIIDAEDCG